MYILKFKDLDGLDINKMFKNLENSCLRCYLDSHHGICPVGYILPCPFDKIETCGDITIKEWKEVLQEVKEE